MHFRVRKNVVQMVRIAYDKEKKRGVTSVIGSVRLQKLELTEELRAAMTPEEIAHFQTWVDVHHRADLLREQLAALTLAETLAAAKQWFEREGDTPMARSCAADIVSHWHMLRKVLVKNGFFD